jgi:hypothetical protein
MLQTALTKRFQGRYQPLQMPTPEQIMGEDLMNNCLVKCLLSGAGGGVLGAAFGIFTASLDTSVRTASNPVACATLGGMVSSYE